MQRALQITSRDFVLTDTIRTTIEQHAAALEQYFRRLTGSHVVLEARTVRHHGLGRPFKVRINLLTPQGEISINRQLAEDRRSRPSQPLTPLGSALRIICEDLKSHVRRSDEHEVTGGEQQ
jgi:ribosome-associated translation inhibitor RaiA